MSIEDTSRRKPAEHLFGMLGSGQSEYIEEMEAAGQHQVVAASQLMPSVGNRMSNSTWHDLVALGFGEPKRTSDEMFVETKLPGGWRKEGGDHAMWSYVLDERGIQRVSIFYKAAWYDREAFFNIIDVGANIASKLIYSEPQDADYVPPALPSQWDVLTADERTSYEASISAYQEQIRQFPDIYGRDGKAGHVQALEDALTTWKNAQT